MHVSSPAELESAFKNPHAIEIYLADDITLTQNLTLLHNVSIFGEGKTIDFGAFSLDAGNNTLTLASALSIKANASKNNPTIKGSGQLVVEEGAVINIVRIPGIHKANLLEGFAEYRFKENATFYAQAETNRLESNKGTAQTALIHSLDAHSFVLERNAVVTLVSDHSSTNKTEHGSSALILRKPKGGVLNIEIQENAELNVTAYGTGLKNRGSAPVLILHEAANGNSGVSKTLVKGKLNVMSNNGNAWYYQYIDYATDTSDYFCVDGGEVNIVAQNGGSKDKTEYAAFESYGRNPLYVSVENGGQMHVIGHGYRGMSLAGGGSYAEKSIVVKGPGSTLKVYGYMWAIAAETQPTLGISALDGGKIVLESCVDELGNVAFSGSTIYSVGPATYNVDGENSRLNILHHGGEYGAIFADGYGVLNINVTRGGNMYVYNKNSGSNKAARRAAICAQSGMANIHSIVVDGHNSVLEVFNDNPDKTNDSSLYPRSAVAFAANTSGNIRVSNGGSFFARNNDADSPTLALGGYGTDNTQGKLSVLSPHRVDVRNDAAGNQPSAVALRSTNYFQNNKGNAKESLEVSGANLVAWPIGGGANSWPEGDSLDTWYIDVKPFVAQNHVAVAVPFAGSKGSSSFKLSSCGRIALEGTVTSVEINDRNIRVRMDETRQLTAQVEPEWAVNKTVAWASDNPAIATVSAGGLLAPTPGALTPPTTSARTTISATSVDGSNRRDSCEVEVYTVPVENIELIPGFPTEGRYAGIELGKEARLLARIHPADAVDKRLSWVSSHPDVLSVTPQGDTQAAEQSVLLRALQQSHTPVSISAEAMDGYGARASLSVRVYSIPVTAIHLNATSITMDIYRDNSAAQTQQLTATVEPPDATTPALHWSSSDNAIATVSQNGLVTPVAPGSAVIYATATDGSGTQAACHVTVNTAGGAITYTVLVKTGDRQGAGTDSNIDIILEGADGRSSGSIRLNPRIIGNAFERNRLDVVALGMTDLGVIQKITLTSDGRYAASDWYIEYVKVIRNGYIISEFPINAWLDRGTLEISNPNITNISSNKPVYVIGHRRNDPEDIDTAIQRGANAVECDIQYRDGQFYVDHETARLPPWGSSTTLSAWLNAANNAVDKYGDMFALVYFDLKEDFFYPSNKAYEHLAEFIDRVHAHPVSTKLNFVYSVSKVSRTGQFAACHALLNPNEGFNVDEDNKVEEVSEVYRNGAIERCWYGNGVSAIVSLTRWAKNILPSLHMANAHYRGIGNGKVPKTMSWTYEAEGRFRQLLNRYGSYKVDAIMVNCGVVVSGANPFKYTMRNCLEGFYALHGLRQATRWDDPFAYNSAWY